MRDTLQTIGAILGAMTAMILYIKTILKFASSKKDNLARNWMFEGFFFSSAVGISIILAFVLISLLF